MARRNRLRGSVMVSALAAVLILTLLAAGASTFVFAQKKLAVREANYMGSVLAAEGGVNHELWNVTVNGDSSSNAYGTASTSSLVSGVTNSSYTAGVTNDSMGTWSSGQTMWIVSKGTYDGTDRVVAIKRGSSGTNIWGAESLFATKSLTINNDLNMDGSMGSNGPITIKSGSNFKVGQTINKAGSGSSLTYPDWYKWDTYLNDLMTNRVKSTATRVLPTVDQLVTYAPLNGWNYLKADSPLNRKNGTIKLWQTVYSSTPPSTPDAYWPGVDTTLKNKKGTVVGTVLCRRLTDANLGIISSSLGQGTAMSGGRTLWFPPGEYYFEQINLSGNTSIWIDNASGPVRIWMDNPASGTLADQMIGSLKMYFTDPSSAAQDFRLYSNKHGTMLLNGDGVAGGFYFINSTGDAGVRFGSGGGSFTVTGAVIGNTVQSDGTLKIIAPTGKMDNPALDPGSGSSSRWVEMAVGTGTTVFPDGTNY